ncbi:MAG: hypothetical protein WBN77_04350 [Desulfobacterales bacterium]
MRKQQNSSTFVVRTESRVQGLVAQGRTATETLKIARDVARKLMEARLEKAKNKEH